MNEGEEILRFCKALSFTSSLCLSGLHGCVCAWVCGCVCVGAWVCVCGWCVCGCVCVGGCGCPVQLFLTSPCSGHAVHTHCPIFPSIDCHAQITHPLTLPPTYTHPHTHHTHARTHAHTHTHPCTHPCTHTHTPAHTPSQPRTHPPTHARTTPSTPSLKPWIPHQVQLRRKATITLSRSDVLPLTPTTFCSLSFLFSSSLFVSLCLSHKHSHSHTHSLSHTHSHSHTPSLTHTHSPSPAHTDTHTHAPTHPLPHTQHNTTHHKRFPPSRVLSPGSGQSSLLHLLTSEHLGLNPFDHVIFPVEFSF